MRRNAFIGLFVIAVVVGAILALNHPSMLNAESPVSWVTVRDTREQAFSIDVPKGWKTYGGMFRFSSVDARPLVDMTSPDGKSNIRVGDATIPGVTRPPAPLFPAIRLTWPPTPPATSSPRSMERRDSPDVPDPPSGADAPHDAQVPSARPRPYSHHGWRDDLHVLGQGAGNGRLRLFGDHAGGSGGPNSQWYVVALGSFIAPADKTQAVGEMLKHSGESLRLKPGVGQDGASTCGSRRPRRLTMPPGPALPMGKRNERIRRRSWGCNATEREL